MAGLKSGATFVIGRLSAACRRFICLSFLANRSRRVRFEALQRRCCCTNLPSIRTSNRREHVVPRKYPALAVRAAAAPMILIPTCGIVKTGQAETFSFARNPKLKGR
jgi:hypothetical protein